MNYVPPLRSAGTIQQTRVKQPWPKDRLFRILSIDGGGIKGIFPASYLAEIEHRFLNGESIANYFDLIAGTSTGGIIALALGKGMSAKEALNIYTEQGKLIFPSSKGLGFWRGLQHAFAPKHDQSQLHNELLKVFGEQVIDSAKVRLVVPSFDGLRGEPFIYKTPHHPDYQKDRHKKFSDVALHTSAAPTYYPGVLNDGYIMIDGGLWANNPIMNALVDALSCYDVPRENIRILTIGTGDDAFTVKESQRRGGLLHWVKTAFSAASRAQSKNALGQAYLLIGKNNVLRIEPPESSQPIPLDDFSRARLELPPVARSLAESSGHLVLEKFLGDKADIFIKCSMT
ncbi:hypothetical protein ABAC460_02780 [Asticcacaulis sp. AC460]|uniref:CBASS cGAMP-activated phospholipase n=1 Tax=Asticcacaulis sp. AC460 TaxID=1282360 RepID=UPI0003C3D94D|nr:CBASS cGAMP-activated phospholipase [Asticcacaulis sp. AC460]ESQ92775.1 hypothetical protein ABAC460_02780 [Asticcacaulis sp. AC460]